DMVVELMNAAQQVVFERFAEAAIQARVERLWQPSAYIGSYGDLASPQISKYIHNWAGESKALATSVKLHETSSWHLEFSDGHWHNTARASKRLTLQGSACLRAAAATVRR
ncbi:MAG: hypothetical protein ACREAB_11320, partial [Blastocatellia bacterium]